MNYNVKKKKENLTDEVCACVSFQWFEAQPRADPLKQVEPLQIRFHCRVELRESSDKEWHENIFKELLRTRPGDTTQHSYPKCFVAESRIQDAGGSCLSLFCSRSFSTLSPSRRSLDGSRTRTLKHTTPACGRSVEAATTSGIVNLSWSSVSIEFKSFESMFNQVLDIYVQFK